MNEFTGRERLAMQWREKWSEVKMQKSHGMPGTDGWIELGWRYQFAIVTREKGWNMGADVGIFEFLLLESQGDSHQIAPTLYTR